MLGAMMWEEVGRQRETLALLGRLADHRDAEQALLAAGWTPCGAGDWAIALRSPDGTAAARISPFDPAGPYTAALYREAAHTRQVPELFGHRRLAGGGDLQIMEWLLPVPEHEAVAFHQAIKKQAPEIADLVDVVHRINERARRELPWWGPLDDNPANVMRAADGRLVVADLFSADGPNLYAAVVTDPDLVVARIPEDERRFMTEIPLTSTGPWEREVRDEMRAGLAAADVRNNSVDGRVDPAEA
ncbi:hypothetical protein ACGFIF_19430 [Kribbella sp. NPDC049174]|uniref:hypothetical protein n=1 Tax=Kribbella sp. NPDC049174 TaxID=3364112 RepID=UPI00371A2030